MISQLWGEAEKGQSKSGKKHGLGILTQDTGKSNSQDVCKRQFKDGDYAVELERKPSSLELKDELSERIAHKKKNATDRFPH